jgi:hypothetical protein
MIDFPVFEERAEDAYQMQHWRMNVRVAGEGMGDKEDVLEWRVRVVLAGEGSHSASLLRTARRSAGHLLASEWRGPAGHLPSW